MSGDQANMLEELRQCETRVWEALVQGDQQADAQALHADFLGVYPDGFAGKAEHVQQLEDGPTIARFALSACRVLPLTQDCAVFSYRAEFLRPSRQVPEAMYVSSIWQRTAGGWVNVFSQDTPAED